MPLPKRIIGLWALFRPIPENRASITCTPSSPTHFYREHVYARSGAHTFSLSPFRRMRICDARYIHRWKQRALHLEFARARACTWLFSASRTKRVYIVLDVEHASMWISTRACGKMRRGMRVTCFTTHFHWITDAKTKTKNNSSSLSSSPF